MIPKFAAVKKLDGFDDTVTPNWLMVGVETLKQVILHNADNLSVKIRNPEIADIYGDLIDLNARQRIITIKGKKRGTTFLDVMDGNVSKTRLEIGVKKRREFVVSFTYVHDKFGNRTIRNSSTLYKTLDIINNMVFLPQANIFIRLGTVKDPLIFERNLGTAIRYTKDKKDIPKHEHEVDLIISKLDKSADMNVVFVNNYSVGYKANEQRIGGIQLGKSLFIVDNINFVSSLATLENVIAHEIAHFLGVGEESHYYNLRNIDGLMYWKARGGLRISKIHANMINRF